MNDLISRTAAIDAIDGLGRYMLPNGILYADAINALRRLPSAQPERTCDTCRYNGLEWDEEPCDSCTMGGESCHWKPSAQPEIIRCKECEHWDTSWQNDYAPNYHYCPFVDGTHRGDFYCADAERRTDG